MIVVDDETEVREEIYQFSWYPFSSTPMRDSKYKIPPITCHGDGAEEMTDEWTELEKATREIVENGCEPGDDVDLWYRVCASPDTILRLIERVRELERERRCHNSNLIVKALDPDREEWQCKNEARYCSECVEIR